MTEFVVVKSIASVSKHTGFVFYHLLALRTWGGVLLKILSSASD